MSLNIDGRVGGLIFDEKNEAKKKQPPTLQENLMNHAAGIFDFAAKNQNLATSASFNG